MNARFACLGLIGALMPLAVDAPVDSVGGYAGTTRARVAVGGGTYAFIARGCEGQPIDRVPVNFDDAGASLEHRIGDGPLSLGVRGGRIRHRIRMPRDTLNFRDVPVNSLVENLYANPHLAVEQEDHGAGVGWVFHRHEFITAGEFARKQLDHPLNDMSAHVRIGSVSGRHFVVQWMEGVPLASSGGYFTALAGSPVQADPHWVTRVGLGAGGPYEGAGLLLRVEHYSDASVSLDVTTRVGISGGETQWGAALGLAYAVGLSR